MDDRAQELLHPLLAARFSPTTFDASAQVTPAEIESLLEAARWAPSAGNSQPWAFIIGRRGETDHARLVRHLAGSSASWATQAGLLIGNVSHRLVQDTEWEYSEFALYDLGQAVAHMSLQAQSLGLHMRQFRAFDREAVAAEFSVASHWEVTTMSAVGRAPAEISPPAPDASSRPIRHRRSSGELRWPAAAHAERR